MAVVAAAVRPRLEAALRRPPAPWVGVLIAGVAIWRILYPAPLGILFLGAVLGSLSALVAIGTVLIYRSNRIVNFAQGDIGGVGAALAVMLVVGSRWNFWLAFATGIAAAALVGAFVEWAVIRRFFKAPRLILTVATIGLTQILVVIESILPRGWDLEIVPSLPTPFDAHFSIGLVTFNANHIVAIGIVPVVILGLGAFFRLTRVGIAVRASAESAERASLLGVPVRRVILTVWILAAVLSAIGAMLRTTIIGALVGGVFGPALLLRALAAAVIGRMENLTLTFVAAIGLGVIEASILFKTGKSLQADAIMFVIIVVALLLRRRQQVTRAEDAQMSTWHAAREVRPIPRELRNLPEVRWGLAGVAALVILLVVVYPIFASSSRVNLAALIVIYGIVGVSLVVLTGWGGQISLGQFAFVGVGAAVAGSMITDAGIHWLFALFAGAGAGALAAVVIGLPALRIRGLFLAVTTLAFALATGSYLLRHQAFPWLLPDGRVPRPGAGRVDLESETSFYFFALFWLVLVVLSVRGLRRSRFGRVLVAARDNERAAQAFGVNLTAVRLSAFAVSGFYAAFAGGLFALHQHDVAIASFTIDQSLAVFAMVVIGGLGSVPGALLGAVYYFGARYLLPADFPLRALLTTGVGMLLVLMIFPGGLGQILYNARDSLLRWVARRRGIVVPSLLADVREEESGPTVATTVEPALARSGS